VPAIPERARALDGLRVIDCATLFAGPIIGTLLGDHGADVVKVEHPRGDPLRTFGWSKDGVSLWWAQVARNKRCVTLDLSRERGQELLRALVRDADVLIENFRPGTLERWNLGPDVLAELNPGLVIARTTGFGQTGPYAPRAGFGTIAEAMSGFAHVNGWPDRPPALPPFALGDTIAGMTGCFAVMFALWWREHGGGGKGQVVDVSLYEPLFWTLGPQALLYDQLGIVAGRTGNSVPFTAPRNAYRSQDGRWLALSGSTTSVAERVARLVGLDHLLAEPWFRTSSGRADHAGELDEAIGAWIGERPADEVIEAFATVGAAIAPVYSAADAFTDPQYLARETIIGIDHPILGRICMPNVIPRLTETPGRIEHPGPELGEHNEEIYLGELGLSPEQLAECRAEGVV
jgi:formyl-CoA transferase